MEFKEPKVEVVPIESDVTTWNSNCPDAHTCDDGESGGTVYCNTSSSNSTCDDVMPYLG